MVLRLPTTQEVFDRNLANLEAALNQTSPLNDKAFLRVLAAVEAMAFSELNRLAIERAKECFALTAGEEGLAIIGEEHGVDWKAAVAAQLTIRGVAGEGTSVPIEASFTSDTTSGKYAPNAGASEDGGYITLTVTAELAGASGNLAIDDTLTMDDTITDVASTWEVMASVVTGLDREDIEVYRRRVLTEIRTVGGGGNSADYRKWAEETPGCYRAFPYSGSPLTSIPEFLDGDMEATGTEAWGGGGDGILSKETDDPYEGIRCLRVEHGEGIGVAYQTFLDIGFCYRITGQARSDGSDIPSFRTEWAAIIWEGTNSTDWQEIDAVFVATSETARFYSGENGYCEYDDIKIIRETIPASRTVYVEADSEIDEDGIAPQWLLDDVREYINIDPSTNKARPPLGMTDETLFVESITRTTINVEVRDLVVDDNIEAAAKARLIEIVDAYFRGVAPHIVGLDPQFAKDDIITSLTVSRVIQDYLETVGATAAGVGIYIVENTFLPSYALGAGELAKLGVITYA